MQQKLTLILSSILGMFTLGGCVYGPGFGYDYYGAEESIWAENHQNKPASSRYGHQSEAPRADRYAQESSRSSSPYRTYTGSNRYGASSDRGRPSGRQYDPGDPPRLSGRVDNNRRPETRYEREITNPPPTGGFNRATPESSGDTLASVPPAAAAEEKKKAPEPPAPKNTPPAADEFGHLPFAVPVPGKAGYVNLPGGANSGLPEIDVRGIAPGTPVEIPDPKNAGKTIQFRVP